MSDVQIEVLKWLAIFVFACGTACAVVGAFLVVSVLARTGVDNVLKAVAYANDLPHNFKKLRAIVKEHERLRAVLEQLREDFPQIEGVIDEDKYPAEWVLQHERQRLHKRLDAALAAKEE